MPFDARTVEFPLAVAAEMKYAPSPESDPVISEQAARELTYMMSQVVERGTHDALLGKQGAYAALHRDFLSSTT